jgi:PAS domain S-box-containing protein
LDWRNKSDQILNALDKPILVIDREYHIVAANSSACRSFCLSIEDIIGQECFKITHQAKSPCWLPLNNCPVSAAFKLKEKIKVVHKHVYLGRTVIEEVIAIPIIDDQGDANFVVEELNDVTELIHSKEIAEHLKNEINLLRGIIPICSSCKKVRDDTGYWQQIESYIRGRSSAEFSHAICPDCFEKLYPEFVGKIKPK